MNLAEPDFTLGALPTTLRMPRGTFAFRLTHRFTRPLADGTVGDFFADFFGFDGAARIGMELRYGLRPARRSACTARTTARFSFLRQQNLLSQTAGRPLSLQAIVAVEGADNFSEIVRHDTSAPRCRASSRTAARCTRNHWSCSRATRLRARTVCRSTPCSSAWADDSGSRSRTCTSIAEAAPQVAGYKDGVDHVSVGVERRAGGHLFQLTITNALGTTMRQVAQGGVREGDWYIGFNLSRRFF